MSTTPAEHGPGDPIQIRHFREQGVFALIVLSIITIGIYLAVWSNRQAKVIARLLPENPVSRELVAVVYVLFVASVLWIVVEIITDDDPTVMAISGIMDWAGTILFLVLTFKIRNRINLLIGARPADSRRLHGLFTFLFQSWYLQWKINQIRRQTPMGFCAQCGYDLTGLPEPRCPECGTSFDPERHRVRLTGEAE